MVTILRVHPVSLPFTPVDFYRELGSVQHSRDSLISSKCCPLALARYPRVYEKKMQLRKVNLSLHVSHKPYFWSQSQSTKNMRHVERRRRGCSITVASSVSSLAPLKALYDVSPLPQGSGCTCSIRDNSKHVVAKNQMMSTILCTRYQACKKNARTSSMPSVLSCIIKSL